MLIFCLTFADNENISDCVSCLTNPFRNLIYFNNNIKKWLIIYIRASPTPKLKIELYPFSNVCFKCHIVCVQSEHDLEMFHQSCFLELKYRNSNFQLGYEPCLKLMMHISFKCRKMWKNTLKKTAIIIIQTIISTWS